MTWKLKQDSYTYADFIFKDGNVRRYYSLDWQHKCSKQRDREIGLNRLRKLILKHGPFIERVAVRENNPSNTLIERYEGSMKVN
jgi:hypothetical protein